MKATRRYDIDWLRVIAIGLLLIYHIAIVFQPWAMFIGFIRSDDLIEDLWTPMSLLNVWRIPLLFFVSGMGVYFAIQKRNWKQLIIERFQRIVIPFLFGLLAIVPIHIFIFQKYYNMPLSYLPHSGHLWFLGNIFLYVLLLFPLFYYLKLKDNYKLKTLLASFLSKPIGPLFISIFFVAEVLIVKPQVFAMYANTWHGFFNGLLAFFFGFLFVYCGSAFWQTVKKWKWIYLLLAITLYIIRLTMFELSSPNYLMAIESNCWIFGLFGLGYNYLNKPSALLNYLSQAAYPVYIIHMFVLHLAAAVILPLEISGISKFIGVVIFSFVLCYLIFEFVIRRIDFLKPLFGMKWQSSRRKLNEQVSQVG
ncbi:acyltransferase family protein [Chondrinema litorale]|uniref:acyltransferase family protein n=1 Tax=Chondrinema litorale TaxID=2994555 RepID=UPI0025431D57|nr:acyltransferase family protein [Chondrinema litorale]UZR97718.1 acyltransferase family protein [Chondrinema litorale]